MNGTNATHVNGTNGTVATTVVDVIAASPSHTLLAAALDAAGLTSVLADPASTFTVFAPDDDAFAALPGDALALLLTEDYADALSAVLLYHVVLGRAPAASLGDGQSLTTVLGTDVDVVVGDDGAVTIGGAAVEVADLDAGNGLVHSVGAVLLPPGAELPGGAPPPPPTVAPTARFDSLARALEDSGDYEILVTALRLTGLYDVLDAPGEYTVFAPDDEAFGRVDEDVMEALLEERNEAQLRNILLYHVLGFALPAADVSAGGYATLLDGSAVHVDVDAAGQPTVDGAAVAAADVAAASNGYAHGVDAVLVPPTWGTFAPTATSSPTGVDLAVSLMDLIRASADHAILAAALAATGLDAALDASGAYTVFAPTDDAFLAALGGRDGLREALRPEHLDGVAELLKYHVVPGAVVEAADVYDGLEAATLAGWTVVATVADDGAVRVDDGQVVVADLGADNGILHVVDAVFSLPDVHGGNFACVDICLGFSCDAYAPASCDFVHLEFGCTCDGCACGSTNVTDATYAGDEKVSYGSSVVLRGGDVSAMGPAEKTVLRHALATTCASIVDADHVTITAVAAVAAAMTRRLDGHDDNATQSHHNTTSHDHNATTTHDHNATRDSIQVSFDVEYDLQSLYGSALIGEAMEAELEAAVAGGNASSLAAAIDALADGTALEGVTVDETLSLEAIQETTSFEVLATGRPTSTPTSGPSPVPTWDGTRAPTLSRPPTPRPTAVPSVSAPPSYCPTGHPSAEPSPVPTSPSTSSAPSPGPTTQPTPKPTVDTEKPSYQPSAAPTAEPALEPTAMPTDVPHPAPTVDWRPKPTRSPLPNPDAQKTSGGDDDYTEASVIIVVPVICVAAALAAVIWYLHHLKPLDQGLQPRETEMTDKGQGGEKDVGDNAAPADSSGLWVGGQETKEEMDETDVAFGQTYNGDREDEAEDNLISLKVEGVADEI